VSLQRPQRLAFVLALSDLALQIGAVVAVGVAELASRLLKFT
jgi:hypothetical protein